MNPEHLCDVLSPYATCRCGRRMCKDCYWSTQRLNEFINASDDHRCIDNEGTIRFPYYGRGSR